MILLILFVHPRLQIKVPITHSQESRETGSQQHSFSREVRNDIAGPTIRNNTEREARKSEKGRRNVNGR